MMCTVVAVNSHHFILQEEFNNLIRDLDLSKESLDLDTLTKKSEKFYVSEKAVYAVGFFLSGLIYCHNISGFMN